MNKKAIKACLDVAYNCLTCCHNLHHVSQNPGSGDHHGHIRVHCTATCEETADIAIITAKQLARGCDSLANVCIQTLEACIEACKECEDNCPEHKSHCRECIKACEKCIDELNGLEN